tara:strand:+ start:93 stop:554 length:462 start_codon:yes stop_codon:yes gene_type:complete
MSVTVEFMNVSGESEVPMQEDFQGWSNAVLHAMDCSDQALELGIRLVNEAESAELNQTFRHHQGSTNVLSFSYDDIPGDAEQAMLGDLVICSQVVIREAREQEKSVQAHWAHMTVHGILHLLGHDHQHDAEAEIMENLESVILARLGYANPYL